MRPTRKISWVNGARHDFDDFPDTAPRIVEDNLTMLTEGDTPDIAKPLTGLGSGVWNLALRRRGEAYRVVYVLQLVDAI
jgi:phage-related protein